MYAHENIFLVQYTIYTLYGSLKFSYHKYAIRNEMYFSSFAQPDMSSAPHGLIPSIYAFFPCKGRAPYSGGKYRCTIP